MSRQPPLAQGYESTDTDPRPLVFGGLLLALLVVGSLAVSVWVTQGVDDELQREDSQSASPVSQLRTTPSGPELQSMPAHELSFVRAREEELLHETQWIDPVNGVVRIPIERAMELSLEEGFPARPEDGR